MSGHSGDLIGWMVTTLDDCEGYPAESHPGVFAICDGDEDDPAMVTGPEWECDLIVDYIRELQRQRDGLLRENAELRKYLGR